MAFSISTNLTALKGYNALAKINAKAFQSQIKLATGKRINSVKDDTSGFNIGKSLEAKSAVAKSKLSNADTAMNYLSTAESSLMQVNDLLTQIEAKYVDSQDAAKDTSTIADDIRSIASEIDSILKNTKFNDQNLLAQSDGSALASSAVFDLGSDVTMDFASSNYLNVDSITETLNGDSGVTTFTSASFDENATFGGGAYTLVVGMDNVEIAHMVDNYYTFNASNTLGEAADTIKTWFDNNSNIKIDVTVNHNGANSTIEFTSTDGRAITEFRNDSTFDLTNLGFSDSSFSSTSGGLTSSDDNEALTAASNLDTVINNVRSSLGRIGNLMQTVDMKSDFLSLSITNSENSVSRLFDADMALEQLNATKFGIAGQAATSILSQANQNPQSILQLFG